MYWTTCKPGTFVCMKLLYKFLYTFCKWSIFGMFPLLPNYWITTTDFFSFFLHFFLQFVQFSWPYIRPTCFVWLIFLTEILTGHDVFLCLLLRYITYLLTLCDYSYLIVLFLVSNSWFWVIYFHWILCQFH